MTRTTVEDSSCVSSTHRVHGILQMGKGAIALSADHCVKIQCDGDADTRLHARKRIWQVVGS